MIWMRKMAEEIQSVFKEAGVDIDIGEIEERLKLLIEKFHVPEQEAKRSVVNYFLKEHKIPRTQLMSAETQTLEHIKDIDAPGRWVNVKGKVVQLWDNKSEAVSQVGLIGDSSGVVRFVKWTSAGLPDVRLDGVYLFKNVVTDVWQGQYSIKLNKNSEIIPLDEDIEVASQQNTMVGAIVAVQQGSGLIKRCPECKRALIKNTCNEHGKVEGVYDLRIKAVLDDGVRTQDVLFNRELTEITTGITLEDAKEMAKREFDMEVVKGEIAKRVLGRYFKVRGNVVGQYLLVDEVEPLPPIEGEEIEDVRARAMQLMEAR
ncbi:MAG: replication factor [Methanosarcinales archaeon]|nr:MAG: Nucleic acid-binding OB-fold tRNA/helicase-type protein [Euryarchaeota archaeon 55_53]KUK29586.1 MAG: Nucleic acid-binding OB-fold tRNA/helicase-type protein [Methanosarcinales archeaon 56_1174]MDI3488699.1 replication factor [Methanosarcinales archaeon]MDN5295878.1 replication factor [Methanosarcinales archaeon]